MNFQEEELLRLQKENLGLHEVLAKISSLAETRMAQISYEESGEKDALIRMSKEYILPIHKLATDAKKARLDCEECEGRGLIGERGGLEARTVCRVCKGTGRVSGDNSLFTLS